MWPVLVALALLVVLALLLAGERWLERERVRRRARHVPPQRTERLPPPGA